MQALIKTVSLYFINILHISITLYILYICNIKYILHISNTLHDYIVHYYNIYNNEMTCICHVLNAYKY